MGVRMVIGRAGVGKTAFCVREIRAEMARGALGGGLLWIVPEQGTFAAERLLLTAEGGGFGKALRGTFRAQVLGFRRLAMRILQDANSGDGAGVGVGVFGDGGKPMDGLARRVLLEEMVRRERRNLTVFGGVADRPGFIEGLDATLREMRQHGHTGQSVRSVAEAGDFGPAAARRFFDLAILLDAWDAQMAGAGAWDSEAWLAAAAKRVGECALVAGGGGAEKSRIWVDAVSAISGLEMQLLGELARHAEDVTITLLVDPDAPGLRNAGAGKNREIAEGLFSRTERLYQGLVANFERAGVRVEKTKLLRRGHRFVDPDLARVEAEVDSAGRTEGGAEAGRDLFSSQEQGDSGVESWSCSDPETEVRAVARRIRQMAVGGGGGEKLRFREIGVICTDLDVYQDAVRRIFSEHGIPHFVDETRTVSHHPLAEFLQSAMAVARSGWGRDEIFLLLKTGLAGIDAGDVALAENYCIEHGIGGVSWGERWTWIAPNQEEDDMGAGRGSDKGRQRLARVNAIREKAWEGLRDFVDACRPAGEDSGNRLSAEVRRDAAGYVRALQGLMLRMGVLERLEAWRGAATEAGKLEEAQVHEQIGREVPRLLEALAGILAEGGRGGGAGGGRERTLGEFELLLAGAAWRIFR